MAKRIMTLLAALMALSVIAPAAADHENGDHPFGDARFEERRDRTERPVSQDQVDRTWIWGPNPYTEAFTEPYAEAPDGERLVQYFDKSRMEINDQNDDESLWSVTNGLLVVEMVDGAIQTGDDEFDYSPEPAEVHIAGDPEGSGSPTYADIAAYGLQDVAPLAEGTVINEHLTMSSIESNDEYAEYGIEATRHVSETNHTIAEPFWNFMNSEGTIYSGGEFVEDQLFQDPFYATGYPITEAYWATTPVNGETEDVLWQCFERRCMTFTPDNPDGWKVETGNVGQHYYEWRYGDEDDDGAETETAQVYLVDMDDPDAGVPSEIEGERLVGVDTSVPADADVQTRIALTAEELFTAEEPGLTNGWSETDPPPEVDEVIVENGLATIKLEGEVFLAGTLSGIRMEEQLEHTAEQFDEVEDVVILLNGGPLEEPAAAPSDGVVATFDVSGEEFRFWTTNEETIDDLYDLEAGESNANIPNGPIHEGASVGDDPPVNVPWGWHLDPEETEMAEVTTEVCDASPSYVEAELDYFVDDVGQYCPWNAELVEIIDYRNN